MNSAKPIASNAPGRRWMPWLLIVGFWMLVALVFSAEFYFSMSSESGNERSWGVLFASQVIHWGLWVGMTPIIMGLARRMPMELRGEDGKPVPRTRWGRWGLVHLTAAIGLGLVHLFFATIGYVFIDPFPSEADHSFWESYMGICAALLFVDVLVYWAVLGVGYAVDYYRKYKQGEVLASQLEAQLAQAQLQALKMQLHPHFLFNTLNAVSTLVRTSKNEAATDMIAGLSELLRLTLESSGAQEVSLKQELDFLERYLDIEQIRFGDRLQVQMDIEPATLHARVPNLLLQPLVENAIRHGIAPRAEAGRVEIRAARDAEILRLQVRDDGPGLPEGDGLHNGVGLTNTIARLQRLYGPDQQVIFANAEDGGALVTLELPFQEA